METSNQVQGKFRAFLKNRFTLINENRKLIIQFVFMVLFVALGIWFFKHEEAELGKVKNVLFDSKWQFICLGIGVTIGYIALQGLMYRQAFASVKSKIPLSLAILLFLKRNFISIFLPAGGVASLAFFTSEVEKRGITKSKIHFGSSVYAFVGILSIVLVAIPIFIYALIDGFTGVGELFGLAAMILVISSLFLFYRSLIARKFAYKIIVKFFPASEGFLEELINHSIDTKQLVFTILISVLIDLSCILSLYFAIMALNFHPSVFNAMMGYLASVISVFISPFMRGLGAVEVSMAFILVKLGYSNVEAVALTFLYRFFEFWLILLAGIFSFILRINRLLIRVLPALLLFSLGIINIISAITPAIAERVQRLQDFIPVDAIAASNYFVLAAGAFLLLTAVFMLKGHRNTWWIALVLSIVSFVGHLTKAIDYEEATAALMVIVMLLFSKKDYHVKGNPRMHTLGISTALLSIGAVLIYGIIGFYFLDKKHFNIDFSILQSIKYTIQNFFLAGSSDLVPGNRFAREFILSINMSGFASLSFLFYTIIKPYIYKGQSDPEGLARVKTFTEKYGKSGLDYFKTYSDKLYFIPENLNAFIAYRTVGNFAVALENPVAESPESMKQCLMAFEEFCYDNGLKSIYYRVPAESLAVYKQLSKKSLFLGQEGIVDLTTFTLEGGKNKALRNAINKVIDRGFRSTVHTPPVKDGLMQKLKAVSDEWLKSNQREEIVFSQGMFVWNELKNQTVITVESPEEKVIAFLNIIPDYAPGEGTYDLIRKTDDAPNGVLDFLLVELFKYLRSLGYTSVNLGFAPMSGLDDPHNFPEKSMKFAYEKIRSFSHYKGLRIFKEKFFPAWHNKYLIYSDDFDLFQIPAVLTKAIRP